MISSGIHIKRKLKMLRHFRSAKKRMTAAARINNVFTIRNVLSAYDCCEMGMAISAKSSIYEWMNSKI